MYLGAVLNIDENLAWSLKMAVTLELRLNTLQRGARALSVGAEKSFSLKTGVFGGECFARME